MEIFEVEYSGLYDLIRFLEYGTHLHIGVLFFGSYGGDALRLPHRHAIHDSAVCEELKNREGGMRRCLRCRQWAIEKALKEGKSYGGECINGVYEYMHPVFVGDECAALIFIGNIRRPDAQVRLQRLLGDRWDLAQTMQTSFDEGECRALGSLIESYMRVLLEHQAPKTPNRTSPLIANIQAYVAENLEYEVTLSDAARLFHYHEQYLGRLFKRETGMRFSDYINTERIKRAALYLRDARSVIQVAYQVGFHNVTYFNRCFKRYFGKTPTEYQRERNTNKS